MTKQNLKQLMKTGMGNQDFKWSKKCGDFDFEIKKNGTWFYNKTEITRKKMVQLFATTLAKKNGEYWLVTPYECGRIKVEDAPFFMVEMKVENKGKKNQIISFRSTLDWWVCAGAENNLFVQRIAGTDIISPYIHIRDGLIGKLSRNCFYELCNFVVEREGQGVVYSQGVQFSLGKM